MPRAVVRDPIYRGCRYSPDIIELCVRWYVTYRLSYRDLVAMMAERGVSVSHTTIMRWVLRYIPEYERRWAKFTQPVNRSWRMDETAVAVRGGRCYLYRAVDRNGKSVYSLLCRNRSMESAQVFFREAVESAGEWPAKINVDGNAATHSGLRRLEDEDSRWRSVEVRARRYLNNIVEQDHRAIKRRCAPMLGLKNFHSAAITLAGVELAHRIHKRQFSLCALKQGRASSLKELWDFVLQWSSGLAERDSCCVPSMHQISATTHPAINRRISGPGGQRCPRKISFGRSLYLLVMPRGGRYWRYRYRYGGKERTLSLGALPDVPAASAKARHQVARQLLATGVDPSLRRKEMRLISGVVT
jgi:transposase-like protein